MAHSQEDHLSEWIEVEQERDYYRKQYELVQKELDEVKTELKRINEIYFKHIFSFPNHWVWANCIYLWK